MDKKREQLYHLLGDLPQRNLPIKLIQCDIIKTKDRVIEHLKLNLNGIDHVTALFVKPIEAAEPLPCVLYNHSHGGNYDLGKNELIDGVEYLYNVPYVEPLISNNYSVLCIDSWCFGERKKKRQMDVAKEMLWKSQTLWGMMVFDSLKAIDYLTSREDVDSNRLGTLGMSMGSQWPGGWLH